MSFFEKIAGLVGQTALTLKLGMALVLEDASGHSAATGSIRLPNTGGIVSRNATNAADAPLISLDNANQIILGDTTHIANYQINSAGPININTPNNGVTFVGNGASSINFSFASMLLQMPLVNFEFNQSNPVIKQKDASGASGTGQTLTVQAQNETGTTSIGGNLSLLAGTGTSHGGTVLIGCGQRVAQVSKGTTYTVDAGATTSDYVILMTGNAFTVTLPVPTAGRVLVFKDAAGNANTQNKTISHNASETIDGATTYVLNLANASVTLMSDGTNWFVIGEYNGTVI